MPPDVTARLEQQLRQLPRLGGRVTGWGNGWAWAYSLDSADGLIGHIVVASDSEPALWAQFLVGILAQQTSIALANSQLYARQRVQAEELQSALVALEHSMAIHDRLTEIAIRGEGRTGDCPRPSRADWVAGGHRRFPRQHPGLDRSWAVPPYPKRSAADQAQVLRRAAEAGGPIAVGDQLLAVASPRPDTLGVIVLVGRLSEVGDRVQVALEHGATVLAMELARLQSVADTELRLGRDLVEELLAHDDETAAISRARAMGYDLDRQHQVAVVVEHPPQPREPDDRFHAVRRAALAANVGTLLVPRGDAVVVLGRDQPDWAAFHRQLVSSWASGRVSASAHPVTTWPGSPARTTRRGWRCGCATPVRRSPVLFYEQLGSYRLLAEISDLGAIDRFVDEWLGPLIAHDERHGADLVRTLMSYLECRGSYDATAAALTSIATRSSTGCGASKKCPGGTSKTATHSSISSWRRGRGRPDKPSRARSRPASDPS